MIKSVALVVFFLSTARLFTPGVADLPKTCPLPTQDRNITGDLPQVVVFLEHEKWSDTNGKRWGPYRYPVAEYRFKPGMLTNTTSVEVSKSKTVTVSVGINETHVCASSDNILIEDRTGSWNGQYNRTDLCNSVCFPANDYATRHAIQVFHSFTDGGFELGFWDEYDSLKIYTALDKEVLCHYRNESFSYHPDYENPDFSRVETGIKKCPVGQQCRITWGRRTFSTSAYVYFGCELDDDQFGGCTKDCEYYEYQGYYRWDITCRYCCASDECNSPLKCSRHKCNLTQSDPSSQINGKNVASEKTLSLFCVWVFGFVIAVSMAGVPILTI